MDEEKMLEILEDRDIFIDTLFENYRQSAVKPFDKAIQRLLDLYKKKSRMVEIMAENLITPTHDKDWVIKYFEDEVELENKQNNT